MSIYDAVKQWALRSLPERWLLPLKKIHYGRVLDSGATDEPEFKVLAHLVRAGDVVMDLGANIGVYTRLLSNLVGARGTVYSLEPIPPTYEILRSVIQRYHLANVKPMAAAVSDHQYLAEMEVPRYPSGGENFYQAAIVATPEDPSRRRFTVGTTTVDAACSGPVHFIKCDVEGHEEAVIRGAARTIQLYRPAWLMEVSKREVRARMEQFGYRTFWFDRTLLRRQTDTDRPVNSFFLTDAHLEILVQRSSPDFIVDVEELPARTLNPAPQLHGNLPAPRAGDSRKVS